MNRPNQPRWSSRSINALVIDIVGCPNRIQQAFHESKVIKVNFIVSSAPSSSVFQMVPNSSPVPVDTRGESLQHQQAHVDVYICPSAVPVPP